MHFVLAVVVKSLNAVAGPDKRQCFYLGQLRSFEFIDGELSIKMVARHLVKCLAKIGIVHDGLKSYCD
jgi:hypothetical protein